MAVQRRRPVALAANLAELRLLQRGGVPGARNYLGSLRLTLVFTQREEFKVPKVCKG